MKSTELTQGVSILLLGFYTLYGFFALPFAGLLLSLAIGFLTYGVTESVETAVASILVSGVLYSLIARSGAQAVVVKQPIREGFMSDGAVAIQNRIAKIKKANVEPNGVYASAYVEGFADVKDKEAEAVMMDKPAEESPESKPASATAASSAGSGIPPPAPPPIASNVKKAETEGGAQGFRGSQETGQFQLGVLPEETKGGYHIDTGTTVMNALNSLKPDQIKAMSEDTQKLIDTQKSLMNMLSSMKPMLQDGKQMMQTFNEMFGSKM
jgi:hypothetical protein